jgi:4-oxalmesaconate hydratase
VIIDCHGHYTTAPAAHQGFRDAQLARLVDPDLPEPIPARISDDEIRQSIEANQLRLARERGTDLTIFSPKASGMGHHVGDPATALAWARACNDLVYRVTALFPENYAGVCQLPQVAGEPLGDCVAELDRCVTQLGFVGCNLNPDPSGGHWTSPPLTDEFWFPLYEKMTELDVPAMIHVSTSCNPAAHTLGAHYLNADTTVFMQLVEGDLFGRFPALRFVIPHGGGAVPYHWGRFHGLAERMGRPPLGGHVMNNVFFDTCVYHRPGIELLTSVIDPGNILFASEMLGAVRGDNPDGGFPWDDTKRYLDKASLPEEDRGKIFELNARRVYPRLDMRLRAAGLTGRADGSCCALAWHAGTTIAPGRSSTARSGRWGSTSPACR